MAISWIVEENQRSENLTKTGETTNSAAPRMIPAKSKEPSRATKGFYMQEDHKTAFDKLAFDEKLSGGKKAPELIEEAVELLLEKYGRELYS